MIPIILLHHNQPEVLMRSIESVIKNTRYPYSLFIVDNNSPPSFEMVRLEKYLRTLPNVCYIKNHKNNWIYGFNLAINDAGWMKSKYYVFSDGDIIFPDTEMDLCWLGYLVQQMEENCCIGKLGLNLSLENIKKNPLLDRTLKIEEKYLLGPKIGSNIVAPVDTTAAIYRNDFFLFDFKFRIGHAILGKPHYYICRTNSKVSAIHLGWDFYPGSEYEISDLALIEKKVFAMSKMGAYVAPEIMSKIAFQKQMFYMTLRLSVRIAHSVKVLILIFLYLVKNFPNKINPIQNYRR